MKPWPPCPVGQCRQCWEHAYNPKIHRALPRHLDECPACVECRDEDHKGNIRKKGEPA